MVSGNHLLTAAITRRVAMVATVRRLHKCQRSNGSSSSSSGNSRCRRRRRSSSKAVHVVGQCPGTVPNRRQIQVGSTTNNKVERRAAVKAVALVAPAVALDKIRRQRSRHR